MEDKMAVVVAKKLAPPGSSGPADNPRQKSPSKEVPPSFANTAVAKPTVRKSPLRLQGHHPQEAMALGHHLPLGQCSSCQAGRAGDRAAAASASRKFPALLLLWELSGSLGAPRFPWPLQRQDALWAP